MTAPAVVAERIGDLLVREGLITRDQLNHALQEQRENGTRVGYNLVALGFIKETHLKRMLARQYRMPAVDLSSFEVDPRIACLIPGEMATRHLVLPLKRDGRTLTVAMVDLTGASVLEDLKFITCCDIFPVIAGEYTLRNAIERYYESNEAQMETLLKDISKFGETDVELVEQIDEDMTAAAMAIAVQDAPVVKLINALLTDAVARGASDIDVVTAPPDHEKRRCRRNCDCGDRRGHADPPNGWVTQGDQGNCLTRPRSPRNAHLTMPGAYVSSTRSSKKR